MNYIKHLNAVFVRFVKDPRLNPTHVSLYMALFQYWNIQNFPERVFVSRDYIMQMSKIGSLATYHRCLKNLHDWSYLHYMPSHNPYQGSQVRMLKFGTSSEQVPNKLETSTEQALVPNINLYKPLRNLNKLNTHTMENEVALFFKEKKWPAVEGKKFFHHYSSLDWTLNGTTIITNWKALAEKWMINGIRIHEPKTVKPIKDHLRTVKNKDYGKPL
ncbi:hypothetical protein U1E44_05000 [Arenibacter sp. GZD96]|uniref:hypothetical protein n=1 Tax=Aurantibrevibacter litoralis TaxID=3106030 RepID=UPI002AFF500A|nr:hypothetical protein [Arenibacter sp. GZD-96]MEA1785439.1 hypothetical protein [Arenibacter sp. GZD-96]